MNYAVVFYSRDGSTAIAAEYLASLTQGKSVRLKAGRYLNNFILGGYHASSNRRPKLKGDPWKEIESADALVLAFPVWAGKVNPAMNSFIDGADLQNKRIYLLAIQADPRKSAQVKVLPAMAEAIKARGGDIVAQLTIQGSSPGKTAIKGVLIEQMAAWKELLDRDV